MENDILFEIHQHGPEAFRATAELYTHDGYFVKCQSSPIPELLDPNGDGLKINGISMSGNTIIGSDVGIWIGKSGSMSMGVHLLANLR